MQLPPVAPNNPLDGVLRIWGASGRAGYAPCSLVDDSGHFCMPCDCEWVYEHSPSHFSDIVRHGENREHVRHFSDLDLMTAKCDRGHALIMEEWAHEVAAYAHGPP